MPDPRALLIRAGRYGLAGMVNTGLGLAVIYVLDLGLHVAPALANAVGYAVGVLASFALSRRFVFQSDEPASATGPRYIAVILTAFLINQAVLRLTLAIWPPGGLQHAAAQLAGMAAYTIFSFLACQVWVFRQK
jgi:putative flippase GtrA